MWVRKQGGDALWQEFATPATALRYIQSEGAPSTLQQVQIECVAKNSKERNVFEFSFEAPTTAAATKKTTPQARANHNPHPIGRLVRSSAELIVLWELPRSVM